MDTVSAASAAVHGPADSDLKYLEPTGGATSAGREEVRDLEKKLQSRGQTISRTLALL